MNNSTQFGALVRCLRKQRGFRQSDLATAWGKSQSAVSQMEKGATSPDLDDMPQLAAALGLRLGDLFKMYERVISGSEPTVVAGLRSAA